MDPNINFDPPPNEPEEGPIEDLRSDLISLSEKEKVNYTSKYLQKASRNALEKIKKYDLEQLELTVELFSNMIIHEFTKFLHRAKLLQDPDELQKNLQANKLFKREVKKILSDIVSTFPHIGLISGGFTTAEQVVKERVVEDGRKMKEPPDTDLDS